MKSCSKQCNECPFRKDSIRGWLADYTPSHLHLLVMSEQPFPCHKTHDETLELSEAHKYPLCKGALAYMKKSGKSPRNPELKKLVQEVDADTLENTLGLKEFFEHHEIKEKSLC